MTAAITAAYATPDSSVAFQAPSLGISLRAAMSAECLTYAAAEGSRSQWRDRPGLSPDFLEQARRS